MAGPDGGTGRGKDPLRAALPLGTVRGIPVRVNWSAAVIFARRLDGSNQDQVIRSSLTAPRAAAPALGEKILTATAERPQAMPRLAAGR